MAKHELITRRSQFYFKRLEQMHPMKTLVYLFLFMSFIAFTFSIYFFEVKVVKEHLNLNNLQVPELYILSTLTLFSSLIMIFMHNKLYDGEQIHGLKKNFYGMIAISTMFIVLQLIASYQMQIDFQEKENQKIISYFIYITGMHLIHLIIVLTFSIYVLFRVVNAIEDPVKVLIYFTNPFEKLLLNINKTLWIYQTAMWMGLFLYLTFRF